MGRKSKVDQSVVNAACNKVGGSGEKVTVGAIIQEVGGSYSTVGNMVKRWREDKKESESINAVAMPESINSAMKRATLDIWQAASVLAGKEVVLVRKESVNLVGEVRIELKESMLEIIRLEAELEKVKIELKQLPVVVAQYSDAKAEIKVLEARFQDRDNEVVRLQDTNGQLQSELIKLVKVSG